MNEGGSTLGGNQTASGGTDALDSTTLNISHDSPSPESPSPEIPIAESVVIPTHNDNSNARLLGQDISGTTDEDLSPAPDPTATQSTAFSDANSGPADDSNATSSIEEALASLPDDSSAGVSSPETAELELQPEPQPEPVSVPTPTPTPAPNLAPASSPTQTPSIQTPPPSPTPSPTLASTPPAPQPSPDAYERQFLQDLHSSDDIIINPELDSKPKKPVVIALVVGVLSICLIGIIAIVVSLSGSSPIANLNKPYPDGMTAETIASQLNSDTVEQVGNFENWFNQLISNPINLNMFLDIDSSEEILQSAKDSFENYKSVYNTILQYNAVQYRDDTVEYFTNAKQKMSTMIPIYERFFNNYGILLSVLSEKDDVSALENLVELDYDLRTDLETYQDIMAMKDEFIESDCIDDENSVYPECYDLAEQISDEISSYIWKKDLRIALFGNDFDRMKMKNNLVKPELRSIQLAPQNLVRENS